MVGLETDIVCRRRRLALERGAAVFALGDVGAEDPDALVGGWIDARVAVVHRPRIGAARASPGRAGVVGAIGAALGRVLDERDEHVRFRLRDRQAEASLVAAGDGVLELLPRRAAVGRFVDRAPRAAAVKAERRA